MFYLAYGYASRYGGEVPSVTEKNSQPTSTGPRSAETSTEGGTRLSAIPESNKTDLFADGKLKGLLQLRFDFDSASIRLRRQMNMFIFLPSRNSKGVVANQKAVAGQN